MQVPSTMQTPAMDLLSTPINQSTTQTNMFPRRCMHTSRSRLPWPHRNQIHRTSMYLDLQTWKNFNSLPSLVTAWQAPP